ncbi:M23 family metallopeptidase [Nocardia mangyaensis]|uniref:M23 family metallopeptidase n=1 Tax=Nocardia mangyaensis TaxID=2213200 RepID=UPI0026757D72|nr:M23 family metallopeptidase [Nocardia mangyaensis]MDO3650165.1 M23 family metallopeptidase [Nocardia mangyaensis]
MKRTHTARDVAPVDADRVEPAPADAAEAGRGAKVEHMEPPRDVTPIDRVVPASAEASAPEPGRGRWRRTRMKRTATVERSTPAAGAHGEPAVADTADQRDGGPEAHENNAVLPGGDSRPDDNANSPRRHSADDADGPDGHDQPCNDTTRPHEHSADGLPGRALPDPRGLTAQRSRMVNGLVLQSNWRSQLPAKVAVRDRVSAWVDQYPAVGEVVGELRGGEFRKVFWERPRTRAEQWWARRPSQERVRATLIERRVLIAGVAVVALLVTADAQFGAALSDRPLAPGEAQRVAIAYPPQIQQNPQSVRPMLDAIAAGEKRREAAVVAAAARATLERAKAEAAAAVSGEWQDWMGERAPVVPGALTPGSTPSTGGFSLPAKGAFTSGFGSRWGTMHRGIDIAAPIGSPIYAVADGTVIEAGPAQGFGLWVRIRHDDGTISIYGHMYDFFVSQGERVPAGMQIARIGNRGDSTGPHLHFEIVQNNQHVDPQVWLAMHGLRLT